MSDSIADRILNFKALIMDVDDEAAAFQRAYNGVKAEYGLSASHSENVSDADIAYGRLEDARRALLGALTEEQRRCDKYALPAGDVLDQAAAVVAETERGR